MSFLWLRSKPTPHKREVIAAHAEHLGEFREREGSLFSDELDVVLVEMAFLPRRLRMTSIPSGKRVFEKIIRRSKSTPDLGRVGLGEVVTLCDHGQKFGTSADVLYLLPAETVAPARNSSVKQTVFGGCVKFHVVDIDAHLGTTSVMYVKALFYRSMNFFPDHTMGESSSVRIPSVSTTSGSAPDTAWSLETSINDSPSCCHGSPSFDLGCPSDSGQAPVNHVLKEGITLWQ